MAKYSYNRHKMKAFRRLSRRYSLKKATFMAKNRGILPGFPKKKPVFKFKGKEVH